MSFGRIILGDNQFLGINHASPAKAAELSDRFARPQAILEVIGWAYEAGIRDFMFTTHDRLKPVLEEIARSRLFPGMRYIPCLPYAHKYANTLTEGGMKAVFTEHLGGCSKRHLLAGLGRLALGDFAALMQLLLEVELMMMRGLPVHGVFLQNVIFDLIVGLRGQRLLERFHRHVSERFGATPGYITMNHPLAQKVLCDEIGLAKPWICANFNVAGFRMNPSPSEVEQSYANARSSNIAMSVLASGALGAVDSMNYVSRFRGVDSILFGSSRKANIEANIALINALPTTPAAALAA
jgi:hypothetical protein